MTVVAPEPGEGVETDMNGSATGAAPVMGVGEIWALPDFDTPPTTVMRLAVNRALPLADSAEDDDEFTAGRETHRRPKGYADWRPHRRTRELLAQVVDVLEEYD